MGVATIVSSLAWKENHGAVAVQDAGVIFNNAPRRIVSPNASVAVLQAASVALKLLGATQRPLVLARAQALTLQVWLWKHHLLIATMLTPRSGMQTRTTPSGRLI